MKLGRCQPGSLRRASRKDHYAPKTDGFDVPDTAQSIYSFRAATVRNILDFPTQFDPPAAIVTLDRNYRSTQAILAAANAVIDQASERFTKNLWSDRISGERPQLIALRDEADQARYVVERVLDNREGGMALKQQSVVFRTSHHSGSLVAYPDPPIGSFRIGNGRITSNVSNSTTGETRRECRMSALGH